MIPKFEPSDTVQFTFTSSAAPDSAPIFKVYGVGDTVISSLTSVQSDSTNYYALYTMPSSSGIYKGEWHAEKTFSGSLRNFKKSFIWYVESVLRLET